MTDIANVSDAQVYGIHASSYATARSTSQNTTTGSSFSASQNWNAQYEVYRGFIKFDTSVIPDSATILSVKLRLSVYAKLISGGGTNYDVIIKKYDWSGSDPISSANKETVYDGALAAATDDNIWKNTADVVNDGTYESGLLNTAWINKTGPTYYAVMSSKDQAGTAPTGVETLQIKGLSDATPANRPWLVVTYSVTKISKISGVAHTSIKKVAFVAIASAKKVAGVDNT